MASETIGVGYAGDMVSKQIGEQLRQARLARGEDVRDIAAYLRIRPDYLAALEEGDFAALPGRPYVSGFLRSYADHLALDGSLLTTRLKPTADETVGRHPQHATVPHGASRLSTGGLVVACLLFAGTVWMGQWAASPDTGGPALPVVAVPPSAALPTPHVLEASPAVGSAAAEQPPLAMLISGDSEVAPTRPDHPPALPVQSP